MSDKTADFLFTGQYLLPDNQQGNVIKNGGIAVKEDTIIALAERQDLLDRYPGTRLVHQEHGLIMPGLINTHTHTAMCCYRGLLDGLQSEKSMGKNIFAAKANLTPESVYQSTLLAIAEMIKSGTTSFCDMSPFASDVARAADEFGIRCSIGEMFYDLPLARCADINNGLSKVKDLLSEYSKNPLVSTTVAPNSVATCSPDLLCQLGELANNNNSLFVIHLLENEFEINACLARYGSRPLQHLEKLNLLGPTTLACHCVKLTSTELDLIKKRNVKVAHCIQSDMQLAEGVAPAVDILRQNITLSLGTDGYESSYNLDMFSEMNSAAKLHKVEGMDPTVMSAEETLHAATLGGAKALRTEHLTGSLEVGKKADFIVLDLNQPHMVPLYNIPSHLTYVARGGDVIHSFVNGRQLMRNRQLLTLDEEKLLYTLENMNLRKN